MMNRISLIVKQRMLGIIFIIIAVVGGVFIFWYISNLKSKISEDVGYKQIFITRDDIKEGEEFTEELIEMQKVNENIFSENFIIDKDDILGKKAAENIMKGDIITVNKLEGMDSSDSLSTGFSSYIPYKLRAVSVPVSFYGDKSLIRTGDRVDILSTYYEPDSGAIYSDIVLSEKEIVLIKSDPEGNFSVEENSSGEFLIDSIFESSSVDPGYANTLILTFYLDCLEAEEVFSALEKGVLNLSICPRSYTQNR
jgi:Flp pilus assembly protein CpaB